MSYLISSAKNKATQEFTFKNGNFVLVDLKTKEELVSFDHQYFPAIYHTLQNMFNLKHLQENSKYFSGVVNTNDILTKNQITIIWRLFANWKVVEFMSTPFSYKGKKIKLYEGEHSSENLPKVLIIKNKTFGDGGIYRLTVGDFKMILTEFEWNSIRKTLKNTNDFDDLNFTLGIPYQSDDNSIQFLSDLSTEQYQAMYNYVKYFTLKQLRC